MGQKTRPTGFRIGITEPWRSRWYANKKEFGDLLIEDKKLRDYVKAKNKAAGISRIVIERTRDNVVVHLHTSRPGVLIGQKGQNVDRLKAELEDLTGRRMDVKIVEIGNASRSAVLMAEDIGQQLEKRVAFRRAPQANSRSGDGERRLRSKDSVVGPARWRRNVAHRKGQPRVDSAFDSPPAY